MYTFVFAFSVCLCLKTKLPRSWQWAIPENMSSFKWRVTVSGELMFLESCGNCDVTNIVTLPLWRHKTIFYYDFW